MMESNYAFESVVTSPVTRPKAMNTGSYEPLKCRSNVFTYLDIVLPASRAVSKDAIWFQFHIQ